MNLKREADAKRIVWMGVYRLYLNTKCYKALPHAKRAGHNVL